MNKAFFYHIATVVVALFIAGGCTVNYYEHPPGQETVTYVDDAYYEEAPAEVYGPFDELSQWGRWIDVHPFGEVWQPYAVVNWRPHTRGHWAWTDWGWTWVSYEPWAWAVYHYGYWLYEPVWGWVWIPDDQWVPANVDWYIYDDFICWAPHPPPGRYIGDPWSVHTTEIWVSVPTRHFVSHNVHRYKVNIKEQAPYRTARARSDAPDRRRVEQVLGKQLEKYHFGVRKVTADGITYKRVVYPEAQQRAVARYQEQTEREILTERGDRARDPDANRRGYKEREERDREEKGRKDEGKKDPQTRDPKEKKRPEKPRKQEPDKKDPDKKEPEKPAKEKPKKPRKQEPDKKDPDKKDPDNEDPEKKPKKREPKKRKPAKG